MSIKNSDKRLGHAGAILNLAPKRLQDIIEAQLSISPPLISCDYLSDTQNFISNLIQLENLEIIKPNYDKIPEDFRKDLKNKALELKANFRKRSDSEEVSKITPSNLFKNLLLNL